MIPKLCYIAYYIAVPYSMICPTAVTVLWACYIAHMLCYRTCYITGFLDYFDFS